MQDLGDLNAGVTSTFTFTVSMPANASNANQDKDAAATYTWVTTQKNAGSTLLRELGLTYRHRRVPSGDGGTRRMGDMGGSWPARLGGSWAGHPH